MKKLISMILVLMLALSMTAVAFADDTMYTDMSTITLYKTYGLENAGMTSPAETFAFSALTCTGVMNAGIGITKENAPVPTIATAAYAAGEAGSATAQKAIAITLPEYDAVGIYEYTFTEVDGQTAGVTYRAEPIKLVVTVIQDEQKIRVAAVHTEREGNKSNAFDNTYSAGSLAVTKKVTGLLGDQNKEFTVKVTFTAPEGKVVREAISYTDGEEAKTIAANWENNKAEATITLKHEETVTFTNIPYGVTYNVVENDYTGEGEGYDAATYAFSNESKTINNASETVEITNNKGGTVDTGIATDSLPYIVLLSIVAMMSAVMFVKRRAYND